MTSRERRLIYEARAEAFEHAAKLADEHIIGCGFANMLRARAIYWYNHAADEAREIDRRQVETT